MPKPSFSNKQAWIKDQKNYRETFHQNKDRNFKHNRHGSKREIKDWGTAVREYLQDEDVDMGATGAGSSGVINRRFNRHNKKGRGGGGGGGGGGGRVPGGVNGKRPLLEGPNSWYKVQVSKLWNKMKVLCCNSIILYNLKIPPAKTNNSYFL